ncbi:MAG: type II toxin-antitoxin system prevent-host-death family antitoxin [Candidatus Aminicenantes bacterium]|nr:type II toxin-antitoxin system prevent-host-death family antitoxin [Candidatus Aminicenantes bacterium]NIM78101.1 type II toxin-antitoxin system prevent-host-death family antitoxin [Candidatus Aminicenantes bacterium]NIN17419.1 type II toxin-antitoxin system prevent-host-death family antitoxin [Candidatus Aminicenantes bacterium]NIN41315.1 type II toxin-antitoxin system prevent-host-death family antitoxin [Candidatus Aminicenantes bacterium]NIN84085.1 type II toxin-antitoxin system prevent-h
MSQVITLTEAKAKFSEIINRIIYKKEKFVITKKGKKVAVVVPPEELKEDEQEGLIKAVGALPNMDETIDQMVESIYKARIEEKSREVNL